MSFESPTRVGASQADILRRGDLLDERYEIRDTLGEGGMGVVLKAHDLRLGREVAVKLMHAHLTRNREFVERFRREIAIAKRFDHPHIVRLHDLGTTETGAMYLVMEFLEGRELGELYSDGSPMSVGRVLRIVKQILDGLAEAHALDIVHRDLKPGNIMVGRDRRGREIAKILDFGIAKLLAESDKEITKVGQVVGTGAYLAPELYLASEPSCAADVYAVGLMMLEMLCGRKVVDAPTLGQLMHRHLHQPVITPPALVESGVAAIIKRAVAKSPDERFHDADEMLMALQNVNFKGSDWHLTHAQIDDIFDSMEREFDEFSRKNLPTTPASNATVIMLEDSDLEILDSHDQLPLLPRTAQTLLTPLALKSRSARTASFQRGRHEKLLIPLILGVAFVVLVFLMSRPGEPPFEGEASPIKEAAPQAEILPATRFEVSPEELPQDNKGLELAPELEELVAPQLAPEPPAEQEDKELMEAEPEPQRSDVPEPVPHHEPGSEVPSSEVPSPSPPRPAEDRLDVDSIIDQAFQF